MLPQRFQWQCHPRSEAILMHALKEYSSANHAIATLQEELQRKTSTRLFDWVDHIVMKYSPQIERELEADGFVAESATAAYRVLHHPGAQFPRVVLKEHIHSALGVAVTVDSIADFLTARGMHKSIEGGLLSGYRRCLISEQNEVSLWVVERRGTHTMEPMHTDSSYVERYLKAKEMWLTRPRALEDEDEAMSQTLALAGKLVEMMGEDLAAWIVLECERYYWQLRNTAGQLQKNRQDHVGMGWANHDHHTFRSSRKHFHQLVRLFEMLGFFCRERYYAGNEAGWGAQIMEHAHCRLILFLDVDLLPNEIAIDFRHQILPEISEYHTVGLWCALHGDSILKAGMHHLEAQFLFENLKQDLAEVGVNMMDPFSFFPFLKQAFTKGEMWPVDPTHLQKLKNKGVITAEQAEKFRTKGAVGSHMENLQRREGYKGFNQQNVSTIIQTTDPRNINF